MAIFQTHAAGRPAAMTFNRQDNGRFGRFSETEYAVMPRQQILTPAEPQPLNLACLRDPALRVCKAFAVTFHQEGGQVVAVAEEVGEYGAGANESEALQDLQHALADLYHSLQEDQHRLGPGLEQTWQTLQENIRPYPEGK